MHQESASVITRARDSKVQAKMKHVLFFNNEEYNVKRNSDKHTKRHLLLIQSNSEDNEDCRDTEDKTKQKPGFGSQENPSVGLSSATD